MKNARKAFAIAGCMLLSVAAFAGTPGEVSIEGKYLEVRSLDVYTAACFANSEVGLLGEEAILTWDISQGSHNGVDLSGLKVVAIVRANDSLIEISEKVFPAKSILILDERATPDQREALYDFAKTMAGRLIENVIRTEDAKIEVSISEDGYGVATLVAGDNVAIETRALTHHDMHCGNDEAYYRPLTNVSDAVVAFTERDMFRGKGLGVTWDESGRRSAYLAKFAK